MCKVRVLKFGGTSVGNGERIRQVARIIATAAQPSEEAFLIVLVSALSGVTDTLLRIAWLICTGNTESITWIMDALKQRHIEAAAQAILDEDRLRAFLADLQHNFCLLEAEVALLPQLYQRQAHCVDASSVAAWGERLSALLLAATVQDVGVQATAVREEVIITRDHHHLEPAPFGIVIGCDPLLEETRVRAVALLHPLLEQKIVPIIPGFIGRTSSGMVKTLGRGGSDLSATVIAAVLDECIEVVIFTDVDGVLSADPHLVGEQYVHLLSHLTYAEASLLAGLGAKVLHPQTLAPIIPRRLPVHVRNTFRPHLQGTVIGPHEEQRGEAIALVLQRHLALITVDSLSAGGSAGTTAVALALAALEGVRPRWICSTVDQHLAFLLEEHEAQVVGASLEKQGAWRVSCRGNLSACVCISSGFSKIPSNRAEAIYALAHEGIALVAYGVTEYGMLLIVEEQDGEQALRCLHNVLVAPLKLAAICS